MKPDNKPDTDGLEQSNLETPGDVQSQIEKTIMKKGTQIQIAFPSDTRLGLGQKPFPNRGGSRHQV